MTSHFFRIQHLAVNIPPDFDSIVLPIVEDLEAVTVLDTDGLSWVIDRSRCNLTRLHIDNDAVECIGHTRSFSCWHLPRAAIGTLHCGRSHIRWAPKYACGACGMGHYIFPALHRGASITHFHGFEVNDEQWEKTRSLENLGIAIFFKQVSGIGRFALDRMESNGSEYGGYGFSGSDSSFLDLYDSEGSELHSEYEANKSDVDGTEMI